MASCKTAWGLWLFHGYPLVYLWASSQKTGSVLSLYYCGLVFVLLHVSTTPALLDGGTLRFFCSFLAVISTALLIISLLFHLLRSCGLEGAAELDYLGLLGPRSHGGVIWVLPECITVFASVASWIAVNTDSEPRTGSEGRSSTTGHGLLAGMLGATSGTNGFIRGAASFLREMRHSLTSRSSLHASSASSLEVLARTRRATLKGVTLQSEPLSQPNRMWQLCTWVGSCALLDCNAFAALYMTAAVVAALFLAFWPAPDKPLWTGWISKAGKGVTYLVAVHLSTAALCTCFFCKYGDVPLWLRVILGEPSSFWRNLQCFCVLPVAVELLRGEIHERGRGSSSLTSGLQNTDAMFELAGMSTATVPSDDQEALEAQAETQSSAAPNHPLRWRGKLLKLCITGLSMLIDENRPTVCIRHLGSLLCLLSLCAWPVIWPAKESVPLLVGGLIALEKSLHDLHPWTIRGLATYQGFLCICCFVTSIWYDAEGDLSGWERDVGFRSMVFEGGWSHLRRSILVGCLVALLQLLVLSCFCLDGAAVPPAGLVLSRRNLTWQGWRSRALFVIRMIIVITVLVLALGGGPNGESSLVQLGYLLWFLCLLYRSDELPIAIVGWDVLRGDVYLWRGLQTYSGSVAVALLFWRSLQMDDFHLVGFVNDQGDSRCLTSLMMHLSLAVLAATQTTTLQAPALHHSSIFVQLTNPVRWLLHFGILVHFGLLLMAALMPPLSIDAFFLLVLACVIVIVAQFSMQRRYFLPLLNLAAAFTMGILLFRCTVSLTAIQALLAEVLPESEYRMLWDVLALRTCNCNFEKPRKYIIALLVLLSRVLGSSIKLSIMRTDESMYSEPLPAHKSLALRVADRWSPLWLILIYYISVMSHPLDFLSSFQLVTLELVLIIGKGWEYAGAFLSGCACMLLIAQYLCRYEFVALPKRQEEYWGLTWSLTTITNELILLVCAIVQRTIHYHAVAAQNAEINHPSWINKSGDILPTSPSDSSVQDEGPDWLVLLARVSAPCCSVLGGYGAHIGIVILVLVSITRSSVWSVAFAVTVAAFLLSGDAARCLKPSQTKAWLKTLAVIVMFAPLSASLLDLWLPPGTLPKPSAKSLGDSVVCSHFEQSVLRTSDGELCYNDSLPDCMPQSQRCGLDWCDWLLIGRGGRPEFLAFFLLCLILRADLLLLGAPAGDPEDEELDTDVEEQLHASDWVGSSETPSSAHARSSAQEPVDMLDRSIVSRAAMSERQSDARSVQQSDALEGSSAAVPPSQARWKTTGTLGVSRVNLYSSMSMFAGRATVRSDVVEAHDTFTQDDGYGWRCIYATTAALWIALFSAFASQQTTDVIAIGYILLLVDHMGTLGNATLMKDPLRAFLGPTTKVTVFNFLVIVASLAFQCPSMPCPYTMKLPGNHRQPHDFSSFMSNEQCQQQISQEEDEEREDGCMLGTMFRCIGLMKSSNPFIDNSSRTWSFVIFILCLLQVIFTSRWRLQLIQRLEAERRRLKGRATWYIAKLLSQRHLQLSIWDNKRQILLSKLNRLTEHLDKLRAIWDGKRSKFTDEEEEQREWENRIENIGLQSGQDRILVEKLLMEFDEAATAVISSADASSNSQRHVNTDKVDEYLLRYLHYCKLRVLRKITLEEEEGWKADLLALCQAGTATGSSRDSGVASFLMGPRWSVNGPQPVLAELSLPTSPRNSLALPRTSVRSAPDEAYPLGKVVPVEDLHANRHTDGSLDSVTLSPTRSALEVEVAADVSKSQPEPAWHLCLKGMLNSCIDDTIFFREGDQTLRQHRSNDGLFVLVVKAIISQSLLLLVLTTLLQFAVYRSVSAAIPAIAVSLSLMAFPHVPWQFWIILQWYNLSVIFAKLLIQLPVFCPDGTVRRAPEGWFDVMDSCPPCRPNELPWTSIFGLLKVKAKITNVEYQPRCSYPYASSHTELLWADLLVTMVLFLSMVVSRCSGRFESLSKILHLFQEQDKAMAEGFGQGQEVKDWLSYLQDAMETSWTDTMVSGSSNAEVEGKPVPASLRTMIKSWVQRIQKESSRHLVGSSWTRRPALDLYPYRFFCMMVCLSFVLFGWSSMMGGGRSFAESVSASNFSGRQAMVLVVFMVRIVFDRALYTWYTHDPCEYEEEKTAGRLGMSRLSTSGSRISEVKYESDRSMRLQHRIIVTGIQKGMVTLELVAIHIILIYHWAFWSPGGISSNLLCYQNSVTCLFYTSYSTYLALTSLQLRYDVHVMRGGLRVTHSTDILTVNIFRIYSALPFLHEMRVLTDWTVTTTSLNFFMWMKLEDAHHNLYRTRCDFEFRAMTSHAEKRPLCEKILTGGLLLLVLIILLVGPVCFFSTVNWFWAVKNPVHSAHITVNLKVQAKEADDTRAMELFSAGQYHISSLGRLDSEAFLRGFPRHEGSLLVQEAVFPEPSDNFWMVSKKSRDQMSTLLMSKGVRAYLTMLVRFERLGSKAVAQDVVDLDHESTRALAQVLNTSEDQESTVSARVPNIFLPFKLLGASSEARAMNATARINDYAVHLELHSDGEAKMGLPYWSLVREDSPKHLPCQKNWEDTNPPPGGYKPLHHGTCRLAYTLASESISPLDPDASKQGGGGGITIMGIYIGVVYTIGNFLRNIFRDQSKHIIYEEMPDTDLLLDLCNGIYIARIQGNLEAEYKLYHELIRIYRSPELLSHICDPKPRKQPETLLDGFPDTPSLRMGADAGLTPASATVTRRTARQ